MLTDEDKREIAAMIAGETPAPEQPDVLEPFERPVRCTVCIATFNSMAWLTLVLKSLARQGERLDVRIADNGSSDGTAEYIQLPATKAIMESLGNKAIRSYEALEAIPHQPSVEGNVAWAKAKFSDSVETEYIFYLDHDVSLPSGVIRCLIEEMEADEKIGAIGLPYENSYDHVEMGALLMRTLTARGDTFNSNGNCVCRNLAKTLADRGLKMVSWKQAWTFGDHLKYLNL